MQGASYQILHYEWQSLHCVDGSNHYHCKSGRVCETVTEILTGFLGIHIVERFCCPRLPAHNIQSQAVQILSRYILGIHIVDLKLCDLVTCER